MLTTLDNAKLWLNLKSADDDALLLRLITSASVFVEGWIGRTILIRQYSERRDGNGKDLLMVANWPVTAVASVVVDDATIPASRILPDERAIALRDGVFTRGRRNIELSYSAGYATVPPDIEQAVIELVALRYRERDRIGHQSKTLAGETVSFFTGDLTHSARTALNSYKKVVPL